MEAMDLSEKEEEEGRRMYRIEMCFFYCYDGDGGHRFRSRGRG